MNENARMFGLALLILILIVAIALGLIAGPTSPLTWMLVALLLILPVIHKKITARKFFEWKDEYSVGIESIDQQHRKLINLINLLQTATTYSTGGGYEREALNELVDYTVSHFGYEEELMEKYDYPDFEPHKKQHQKMIDTVNRILDQYEQNPDLAMRDAHQFLKDWLIQHINGTDKQYSDFLISKGVK